MIPHIWGIAGLVINTASAFGLLFFKQNPYAGSPLTREQYASALPEAFRKNEREIRLYKYSVIALAVGFILQLVDLVFG